MIKAARSFLLAILALGILATGTISSAQNATTTHKTTATTSGYDRALLHPALLKDKAPEKYEVKVTTTKGEFTITVTRAWSPLGADRFYNLVKHHFYDNASFFRVLNNPPFMAQFGVSAYPAVSAAWDKAEIKDDPVTQSNIRGYVSFATSGPNTRTTQVFINYGDNKRLDSIGFSPFGVVTDGMNVVDSFYGDYGEGAPDGGGPAQDQLTKQGKSYLDKGWPKLDAIKTAVIVGAPVAAAKKPAAPAVKNP